MPEPRNLKSNTQNPKPETRYSKPEIRNPKPEFETRNPKSETRYPASETRATGPETRMPKPDTRNPKPDARNHRPYGRQYHRVNGNPKSDGNTIGSMESRNLMPEIVDPRQYCRDTGGFLRIRQRKVPYILSIVFFAALSVWTLLLLLLLLYITPEPSVE